MSDTATLIERRDARQIRQLARDLCVSVETVPTGDGRYFTVAPVSFLLQLRDAFGDDGMADVYAVIDGPALRALKPPAGLRSLDHELAAVRAVEAKKAGSDFGPLSGPPRPRLRGEWMPLRRREIEAEREANARARSEGKRALDRDPAQSTTGTTRMTGPEAKAARDRLGLTNRQFAAALGISLCTVNNWMRQEKDRHDPTAKHAAAIRHLVAEKGA